MNKKLNKFITISGSVAFLVFFFFCFSRNNAQTTKEGLVIEDIVVGKGAEVVKGKTISINYVGKLLKENRKFDSSYDRGIPYTLQIGVGHALPAWDKGLIGMKMGGKRRLTVPPELGYGDKAIGSIIPPKSKLVYEFELITVK